MAQSRLWSFLEANANVVIGFAINYVANLVILPLYGFAIRPGQAFSMGLVYTGISLGRQYVIRRWFNLREERRIVPVNSPDAGPRPAGDLQQVGGALPLTLPPDFKANPGRAE